MLFRKKRAVLTREQSLKSVPVKNQFVEETRTESGEVVLYVPRRKVWWLKVLSKVLYVPGGRKVNLDELGSTVWGWLDNETNVGQLIKKFSEKYRLSRRESELSVVAYLRTLAKRGLIGIAVIESSAPRGKAGKKGSKQKANENRGSKVQAE